MGPIEIEKFNELTNAHAHQLFPSLNNWVGYDKLVVTDESGHSRLENLPEERWRYWALAFEGNKEAERPLEQVALLLKPPLEFAAKFFYTGEKQTGGQLGYQGIRQDIVERFGGTRNLLTPHGEIDAAEISRLSVLASQLEATKDDHRFVGAGLTNFANLRRIPTSTDLYVVGLFSIIELLVTHSTDSPELDRSITHQISKKLPLLRQRFLHTVEPSEYFQECSEESVWKKLYRLRSKIAHGADVDFSSGPLSVLNSRESTISFLSDCTVELLLIALREPEFLAYLREC